MGLGAGGWYCKRRSVTPEEGAMRDPFYGWGPWTIASFSSQDARDSFLRAATSLEPGGEEAEPMLDEARGAWVRWRPGHFFGLNDIAYAHGGRIVAGERRDSR